MADDRTDVDLFRTLALIRFFACVLEDDNPPNDFVAAEVDYFIDANVIIFLSDPISEKHRLGIFAGNFFETPRVDSLAEAEESYLAAFAHDEAYRLQAILKGRKTHLLRPHALEVSWQREKLAKETIGTLGDSDEGFSARERTVIEKVAREIKRVKEQQTDAKAFFDVFLANYSQSAIRHVSTLQRMNRLIKSGLLRNPDIARWQDRARPNIALVNFFYKRLMIERASEKAGDVTFLVMADAEALALVCQYAKSQARRAAFITFDRAIFRMLDLVYSEFDSIEAPIRDWLPQLNFARHPIIFTKLISEDGPGGRLLLRRFVRDIDFLFHKLFSGDYRTLLGEIVCRNKLDSLNYLLKSKASTLSRSLQSIIDRLSRDFSFVHEDSAVNAVAALLRAGSGVDRNNNLEGDLERILNLVSEQIETRSVEKATALVQALTLVHFVDIDMDGAEHKLVDEARLILGEVCGVETEDVGRNQQLLRNWPGWIRISPRQQEILQDIVGDSEAFINTLRGSPPSLDTEFYLIGAVISALANDWLFSERYALVAIDLLGQSDDKIRAEAEYWIAVSIHYQQNPGYARLASAYARLNQALVAADAEVDRLRFEVEQLWISILLPYHHYIYGGYDAPNEQENIPGDVLGRFADLDRRFKIVAKESVDPIIRRLGIHLYSGICLFLLFSRGLKPGRECVEPIPDAFLRKQVDPLRRWSAPERTLSKRIRFTLNACEFLLDGDKAKLEQIEKLSESSADILIAFDRRMVDDFLLWVKEMPPRKSSLSWFRRRT